MTSCEPFSRPVVRFSSDEATACRLATNEVQFFDTEDFSKGIVNRLRVPGIAALELSKSPGSYVAVFVPESKVSYFDSLYIVLCFCVILKMLNYGS